MGKNPLIMPKGKPQSTELKKSAGILDDFAIRKVEQTQELLISKWIKPSTTTAVVGTWDVPFDGVVARGILGLDSVQIGTAGTDATYLYPNDIDPIVDTDIIYYLPVESKEGFLYNDNSAPSGGGKLSWKAATEPTGTILMYGAATAPTGYLMCHGQAVSRTTYSALFAVISTNFGVGDGSTTFNVPDFNGNYAKGLGSGGAPGSTGGSTSYTPEGDIDSHEYAPVSTAGMIPNVVSGPGIHTFTGKAATIEPPYLAVQFIIKY
jgi:microcystin-dependent protein